MRTLLGGAVLLAACTSVLAQELPNRPSLSLDEQSAWIVTTTKVGRQLKLDSDQKHRVNAAFEKYDAGEKVAFAHGAATTAQLDKLDHELAAAVLETLNPGQRQRLHEIALQLTGSFILDKKPLAEEVGLKPEQWSKVHGIVQSAQNRDETFDLATAKTYMKYPKVDEKLRQKIEAGLKPQRLALARKKRADEEKIIAILTPAQKAKWNGMLGPKMP